MSVPPVIEGLSAHPEMLLTTTSYDTAVSFISGYDAALLGGLLLGFREWLITRLKDGNNLSWPALIDMVTERSQKESGSIVDDEVRRAMLFDLLFQFLAVRRSREGMRSIFGGYEAWLATQSWSRSTERG